MGKKIKFLTIKKLIMNTNQSWNSFVEFQSIHKAQHETAVLNHYKDKPRYKTIAEARTGKGNFICLVNLPNGETFYTSVLSLNLIVGIRIFLDVYVYTVCVP